MKICCAVFFLMLHPLFLFAEEGKVTFSSGRSLEGKIRLTEGKKLTIYDLSFSKRFHLDLKEIARIDVEPAHERMEQVWRFKEEGSPEKIKEEVTYPVRTYRTFITLKDGMVLSGSVIAVCYVDTGKVEERFILLGRQKGKPGDTLDDLSYVRSMDFSKGTVSLPEALLRFRKEGSESTSLGKPPPSVEGTWILKGRIPGVQKIAALNRERAMVWRANGDEESGAYALTGLLPGSYDLFLRYPERIVAGMVAAKEMDLREETHHQSIEDAVRQERDFFEEKRLLKVSLCEREAAALVEVQKTKEAVTAKRKGKIGLIRIYAYLFKQTPSGSWHVTDRLLLFRVNSGWGETAPVVKTVFSSDLAGVSVGEPEKNGKTLSGETRTQRFDYGLPEPEDEKKKE